MHRIVRIVDKILYAIENALVITILSVMIFLAFLQVVLRNLFSTGIFWGDIFLRQLVLWVGLIGASLATRQGRHINIDVFSRLFPPRIQHYIHTVTQLVAFGVCIVLARAAYTFVAMEKESGSVLILNIPTWIFQLIIPIGFVLIALRFLTRIVLEWETKNSHSAEQAEKQ